MSGKGKVEQFQRTPEIIRGLILAKERQLAELRDREEGIRTSLFLLVEELRALEAAGQRGGGRS